MLSENRDLFYIKLFTGFIATVIFVLILKQLKTVFLPLFMALLLYFLFNGVVKKLMFSRILSKILPLKLKKIVVLFFLLVFIFIVFYFLGVLVYAMASSFIKKLPAYSDRIGMLIENLSELIKVPISDVNSYINNMDWSQSINTITSVVSSTFGSFASFMGNLVLVVIFLMFMLAGRQSMVNRVNKAFNESKGDKIIFVLNSIEDQVQQYLLIKTSVSVLTAVVSGFILYFGGFDFVIFSAFLIFILNFIPNFGSVIATVFPVLIGLINHGFSVRVLIVGLALILTQMIVGNVIEPSIAGKKLNLSPIVILISLIFWGWIWGVIGMILAVPLTSAVKILFEHIDSLNQCRVVYSVELLEALPACSCSGRTGRVINLRYSFHCCSGLAFPALLKI
jgi:predicted PurR-regulated permease PerM